MTDQRNLSHMSEQCQIGHAYLTRWAQAVKKDNPQPWPSITLLGRIIEQGGHYGSVAGTRPTSGLPDDLAAVDSLVSHMRGDTRHAVLAYYGKWETMAVVARQLHWSTDRLKLQLRLAREIVAVGVAAKVRAA